MIQDSTKIDTITILVLGQSNVKAPVHEVFDLWTTLFYAGLFIAVLVLLSWIIAKIINA